MLPLLNIHWNPDPELFNLFGISIRYYGLLWVIGLAFAYFIVQKEYRDRRIGDDKFEPLFFYCFFGILIGARLGHCLFYQPDYYLHHFWEMILPVKFLPDGGWKFTGYEGLASHGGTLGLIIALWMYCRKTKMHYMDVLDMIAVATPITACCIRLANLMNSEIIGRPTDVPWAFVFERVDMVPRHPAQFYEALAYFVFFLGMVWLYKRGQKQAPAYRLQQGCESRRTSHPALSPRLFLRPLPNGNLRLPLLHRVPQGEPGGLRGRHDAEHGPVAQCALRPHRPLLHVLLRTTEEGVTSLWLRTAENIPAFPLKDTTF